MILTNTSTTRAGFQFLPLPGVMFGDAGDRVYRPAPRWASVSPQQVRCLCVLPCSGWHSDIEDPVDLPGLLWASMTGLRTAGNARGCHNMSALQHVRDRRRS